MSFITAQNITVEMPIYEISGRSMKMQVFHKLKSTRFNSGSNGVTVIQALRNLSFEVSTGDRVGLIGNNGAGKSTLLRVLAGIYEPSAGQLRIEGKTVALLEMGLGMDDTMTGYQNIKLRGMLLGMTAGEVAEKTSEIAEFTGLAEYLHLPLRTYSSGMRIRLAFAISTAVDAEILLLDEVIGVGDANFLDKANKRLKSLHDNAHIVFLASHSNAMIENMCNKVIWLEAGEIRFIGETKTGLKLYDEHNSNK